MANGVGRITVNKEMVATIWERCTRWAWRARGGRGVRAVGVAYARWAWRQRENCSVKKNSVKKQRINAKSELSKCSRLPISRRRQSYAMIGVELRTHGEIFVKSLRQKCSFAYVTYSSKDSVKRNIAV